MRGEPRPSRAVPLGERAVAPDLARGGMLLLIALANVHLYLYGHEVGVRGYPRDPAGVDRVVAAAQLMFVDGRAYPLFGLLFGYGVVQLARRRAAHQGADPESTVRLVRRRGWWMIAIGAVHAVLLFSGDIVGPYGLLAVLLAGLLVRGGDRTLRRVAIACVVGAGVLYAPSGLRMPGSSNDSFLPSMAVDQVGSATAFRAVEWVVLSLTFQGLSVVGAVVLGALVARRQILEQPQRHRRLLVRVAVAGLAGGVVGGLPFGLLAAGVWTGPPVGAVLAAGSLHAVGGYAGGLGYAALFGLLTIRVGRHGAGRCGRALVACGQRSLSCYLAQSVVFAALLPAWSLGLGAEVTLWQAALLAAGTWVVTVVLAAWSARVGNRGPAELLLRRLTYAASDPGRSREVA